MFGRHFLPSDVSVIMQDPHFRSYWIVRSVDIDRIGCIFPSEADSIASKIAAGKNRRQSMVKQAH